MTSTVAEHNKMTKSIITDIPIQTTEINAIQSETDVCDKKMRALIGAVSSEAKTHTAVDYPNKIQADADNSENKTPPATDNPEKKKTQNAADNPDDTKNGFNNLKKKTQTAIDDPEQKTQTTADNPEKKTPKDVDDTNQITKAQTAVDDRMKKTQVGISNSNGNSETNKAKSLKSATDNRQGKEDDNIVYDLVGVIRDITSDIHGDRIYFIRVDCPPKAIGKQDVFLHSSRIVNSTDELPLGTAVKLQAKRGKKGFEAVHAGIISPDGGVTPEYWISGVIVSSSVDKTNQNVYIVKPIFISQDSDVRYFLHSNRLGLEDKFFQLLPGTKLNFRPSERCQEGSKIEIFQVKLMSRKYDVEYLLQTTESYLKKEDATQLDCQYLISGVHAFKFLGCNIKSTDVMRALDIGEKIMSLHNLPKSSVKNCMEAFLSSSFLNTKKGPLQEYLKQNKEMLDQTRMIEYFTMIVEILPQFSNVIYYLIKDWFKEKDVLLKAMMEMLKIIGSKYIRQIGSDDTTFLDYKDTPLVPTNGELTSLFDFKDKLMPVKQSTPYQDCLEYMETYFRLQRAEGFSKLINGIRDLQQGNLDYRDMNVFTEVFLVGPASNERYMSLALRVKPVKQIKDWKMTKQLMCGNLVCLTCNGDFTDPIWAKICMRDDECLKQNSTIFVELIQDWNCRSTQQVIVKMLRNSGRMVMVETPMFYISFGPNLQALQKYDIEALPLKTTIVRGLSSEMKSGEQLIDEVGSQEYLKNFQNLITHILSKLSKDRPFDVYRRFKDIQLDTGAKKKIFVNLLIEKAMLYSSCCSRYIEFCQIFTKTEENDIKSQLDDAVKHVCVNLAAKLKMENLTLKSEVKDEEDMNGRHFSLFSFIGELFQMNILCSETRDLCVRCLLNNADDLSYESACVLLDDCDDAKNYVEEMKEILKKNTIGPSAKALISCFVHNRASVFRMTLYAKPKDISDKNSVELCTFSKLDVKEDHLDLFNGKVRLEPLIKHSKIISEDNSLLKELSALEAVSETTSEICATTDSFIKILEADNKLDSSQAQALKHALTNRVALIQGPPGAGKTFIGIQLIDIFLNLLKPSVFPIIVITYKNRALDDMLMGLINSGVCGSRNICRIGGGSKESTMWDCNIRNLKADDFEVTSSIKDCKEGIANLSQVIKDGFRDNSIGLTLYEILKHGNVDEEDLEWYLPKTYSKVQLMCTKLKFRLSLLQICAGQGNTEKKWRTLYDTFLRRWFPADCQFRDIFQYFTSMKKSLVEKTKAACLREVQNENEPNDEDEDAKDWHAERRNVMSSVSDKWSRSDVPKLLFDTNNYICTLKDFPEGFPTDESLLERNILYLNDIEKIKFMHTLLMKKVDQNEVLFRAMEDLEKKNKEKSELETAHLAQKIDCSNIKIIGMTITGASIYNDLLKRLNSEIVLVEEAAEVLEPQLLVALTPNIKHLIQIGDHHQLPPQVDCYELKRSYHFDVSMMQRLIQNNLPFAQLEMQNRMRPDISVMLKDIYPGLKDNLDRVESIELPHNISYSSLFWNHEEKETPGRSRSNQLEVHMALSLATLLVSFKHEPKEITILCAYLGQKTLMQRTYTSYKSQFPKLYSDREDIVISTIDNYQGDENSIVIVSLVRSNEEGQTGFLKDRSRRCVAQSRAKSCVVFIGNERTVRKAGCWDTLLDNIQYIGDTLPLGCKQHPHSNISARDPESIKKIIKTPSLVCSVRCAALMPCELEEHACEKTCEPKHEHGYCKRLVPYTYKDCGHTTSKECSRKPENVRPCKEIMNFTYPKCGHKDIKYCSVELSTLRCKENCKEQMNCREHKCPSQCGDSHSHSRCMEVVEFVRTQCGHSCRVQCHEKETPPACRTQVMKTLSCGHSLSVPCAVDHTTYSCRERVRKTLVACGHLGIGPCSDDQGKDDPCKEECKKLLPCNHACMNKCYKACTKKCDVCQKLLEMKIKTFRKDANTIASDEMSKGEKEKAHLVEVTDISEIDAVKELTMIYIVPEHNWFPQITKVERVINHKLEAKWWQARARLFDPLRDEERKFHGTSENLLKKICLEDGFSTSKSISGMLFGQGIYFSSCSSKAAQNSGKLLLCRVLLGKSLTTRRACKELNSKKIRKREYDSVYAPAGSVYAPAGSVVRNDQHVIYNPSQALPQYIIHYTEEKLKLDPAPRLGPSQVYEKIVMLPSRTIDKSDPLEYEYALAEAVFYRLELGTNVKVRSIEIYKNPKLERMFGNFNSNAKSRERTLMFFDAKSNRIHEIMENNFSIAEVREVVRGRTGILFSMSPQPSTGHVEGCQSLILCQLLHHSKKFWVKVEEKFLRKVRKDCKAPVHLLDVLPKYVINYS